MIEALRNIIIFLRVMSFRIKSLSEEEFKTLLSNCTYEGIFVYVINANCRYEIQVMYHAKDANILTANASLYYVVGEWTRTRDNNNSFERKLLFEGPLYVCLEKAVEDKERVGSL